MAASPLIVVLPVKVWAPVTPRVPVMAASPLIVVLPVRVWAPVTPRVPVMAASPLMVVLPVRVCAPVTSSVPGTLTLSLPVAAATLPVVALEMTAGVLSAALALIVHRPEMTKASTRSRLAMVTASPFTQALMALLVSLYHIWAGTPVGSEAKAGRPHWPLACWAPAR